MMGLSDKFKNRIHQLDEKSVAVLLAVTAFLCYTCMYSFRKSFTAASFDDETIWGINYKVCLVITQMIGYMISKFYGIKFIAESKHKNRGRYLILLISIRGLVYWHLPVAHVLGMLFFSY